MNAEQTERLLDLLEKLENHLSSLWTIGHELSGFHTGNSGDNPLLAAFHEIAKSNNNIADAIREAGRRK